MQRGHCPGLPAELEPEPQLEGGRLAQRRGLHLAEPEGQLGEERRQGWRRQSEFVVLAVVQLPETWTKKSSHDLEQRPSLEGRLAKTKAMLLCSKAAED